jgi:DNA replication protein DnaC
MQYVLDENEMVEATQAISDKLAMLNDKMQQHKSHCEKHNLSFIHHCPKCYQEQEDTKQRLLNYHQYVQCANIPKRFLEKSFDTYQPEQSKAQKIFNILQNYAKHFSHYCSNGISILMSGNTGTGKTHLAISLMQYVMRQFCLSTRYTTAYDLIAEINETYQRQSRSTERQVKSNYEKYDLLVIDEFGCQRGRENDHLHMFDLINKRYNNLKSTIVISNLSFQELTQSLGQRNISRLCEGGLFLSFDWDDWRKGRNLFKEHYIA